MTNKATIFGLIMSVLILFGCSGNSTSPDNGGGDDGGGNGGTPTATADAGTDSEEAVGFEISADGSGSTGSGTISYSWSFTNQPANSTVTLSNASSETPTFTPDLPGEYILELEVSSDGETDADTVVYSAIAKRIFVDANSGTDEDINGYMEATPLKTVSAALTRIGNNDSDPFLAIDTMRVAKGTYDENNGESYPLSFIGNLIVKGDQSVDRSSIHLLSPDVERDPAIKIGEGVILRHLHIENGYTGGTFNGDPDAVYIWSGSDMSSSTVALEDIKITMNAREGVAISTGSNMTVDVRGYNGTRSYINGNNVGRAYLNRFNTSNVTLNIKDTDISNMGDVGAIEVDDVHNLTINVTNSVFKPGTGHVNAYAFDLEDDVDLTLENTTITSSTGSTSGARFKYGIVMDNDQPNTNIEILNSTIEYTQWSAVLMRASVVKITDSIIEGVLTQESNVNLAYDAIRQLDGTLIVRGTTFKDINTSAIDVGGPNLPNDNNFSVDLGTDQDPGNNVFQNVRGWDVQVSRSGEVVSELPAFGNSWSNGASPRCRQDVSDYDLGEIYVNDQGGSLRWGTGSSEICN
ncbi:PKD domain-containing protein [Fodinibius saliphilus]|uniref:PKD domain-containing protein n=1 Tax=Fodinibius saliphilus TaxID=1920650 RepID=UPI0011099D06|nr:DUF1565 domain-containing protein [Fodinibius saliphilus]